MQGEEKGVHGRRQVYKRSQTVASLPLPLQRTETERHGSVPSASTASDAGHRLPQWLISGLVRDRGLMSSRASIPGCVPQEKKRSLSGGNVCEMAVLRSHCNRTTTTHRHSTAPDNWHDIASAEGGPGGGVGGGVGSGGGGGWSGVGRRHGSSSSSSSSSKTIAAIGLQHSKRLGRTPSSPSVLLSKVKERIREKVFETSAEWPHMAAIVQERRQRAADAFEARMSLRRLHLMASAGDQDPNDIALPHQHHHYQHQQQSRMRRVRVRSDPVQHKRTPSSGSSCSYTGFTGSGSGAAGMCSSFDKDGARMAFRRRSISDDTYNQQRRRTSCSLTSSSDRGGIVCSDDDLRAIVYEHRLRRSPVSLKHQDTVTGAMDIDEDNNRDSAVFPEPPTNVSSTGIPAIESASGLHDHDDGSSPAGQEKKATDSSVAPTSTDAKNREIKSREVSSIASSSKRDEKKSELTKDPAEGETETDDDGSDRQRRLESTDETTTVVPDIVFDEHGQTWDVYGAEFDPEILGQAIQNHLEKIMKRRMSKNSSEESTGIDQSKKIYSSDLRGSNDSSDRALGFFLRYLCFVARSREHVTQTS